jgi:hypothetical protein
MSNQPKNGWSTPKFHKLDELQGLMEKILNKEIEVNKEQMQRLHNVLEVKRKLEHRFGRKK